MGAWFWISNKVNVFNGEKKEEHIWWGFCSGEMNDWLSSTVFPLLNDDTFPQVFFFLKVIYSINNFRATAQTKTNEHISHTFSLPSWYIYNQKPKATPKYN